MNLVGAGGDTIDHYGERTVKLKSPFLMAECDDRTWRSVELPVSPTANHGLLANVADDSVSGDVMAPIGAEICIGEWSGKNGIGGRMSGKRWGRERKV